MKVLFTQHINGTTTSLRQTVHETDDIVKLFGEINLCDDVPLDPHTCSFTTVNEHGIFINGGDCYESYVIIS